MTFRSAVRKQTYNQQQSATPVPTPQSVQEAPADVDVMRWNAAVLETIK